MFVVWLIPKPENVRDWHIHTMVDVGGKIFQGFEHVNENERTHLNRYRYVPVTWLSKSDVSVWCMGGIQRFSELRS